MRQVTVQQAFNIGELSEGAWSRTDLAQHAKGCRLGLNFVCEVIGEAARRRGTWYAGAPKSQTVRPRALPFRKAVGDALVLELGHLYMRVWNLDRTLVESSPGVPYELVTTWTEADLPGLRWKQIGDLIFMCHLDGRRPRVIARTSDTSWSIADWEIKYGPWRQENVNENITIEADGVSGTVALLAQDEGVDADLFTADHVGCMFRLRQSTGQPGGRAFEPDKNYADDEICVSDGKVFANQDTGSTNSGSNPPVHDRGVVSDGKIEWRYMHDGAGVVLITAVTDGAHAEGTVLVTLPGHDVVGGKLVIPADFAGVEFKPSSAWSEGAYSDFRGWPTAWPGAREERLVMAATLADPDVIDFTRTAGFSPAFADFKPGLGTGRVVDDDAVRRTIGDEPNRILSIERGTYLAVMTTAAEYLVTGAQIDDPISPASCTVREVSSFGSADVKPCRAHSSILFVAKGGQTLRELLVAPNQEINGRDLQVVASHIGERGLRGLGWQAQPDNRLWVRLADEGLASFTYHAEQRVEGWNSQALAGYAIDDSPWLLDCEPVTVPRIDAGDQLWLFCRRTKSGSTQRAILVLGDPAEALFYDAAEAYEGAAVGTVDGLDHLEGETVSVLADGAEYTTLTVTGGEVTLPNDITAASWKVGMPYLSRFEGLPQDFDSPAGSAAKRIRYDHIRVVCRGADFEIGSTHDYAEEGESADKLERVVNRPRSATAGPQYRRVSKKISVGGGAEFERRIVVQTDKGWDLRVSVLRGEGNVSG